MFSRIHDRSGDTLGPPVAPGGPRTIQSEAPPLSPVHFSSRINDNARSEFGNRQAVR